MSSILVGTFLLVFASACGGSSSAGNEASTAEIPAGGIQTGLAGVSDAGGQMSGSLPGKVMFSKSILESGKSTASNSFFVIDPNGGEPDEVKSGIERQANQVRVSISHDCGELIIAEDGNAGNNNTVEVATAGVKSSGTIEVMNADGSSNRSFTPMGGGRFLSIAASPTKDTIAFVRDQRDKIYFTDYSGKLVRTVQAPGQLIGDTLSWSPDGKHLAFVADVVDERDIYIIDSDGNNLTNVTHNVVLNKDTVPGWQDPNVPYEKIQDLIQEKEAAGKLIDRPFDPKWAPDSKSLAFIADIGNEEIWIADINNHTNSRLWVPDSSWSSHMINSIDWSPDGKTIAFSTDEQYSVDKQADIGLVDADGSNARLLLRGSDDEQLIGWFSCSAFPSILGQPS